MFRFWCCEMGWCLFSVAIKPKPKKGGSVSSNTGEIPEMLVTGVEGSTCWSHPQVDMHGGKVQQRRFHLIVLITCDYVYTCTDK